jgi:hypothetical protein
MKKVSLILVACFVAATSAFAQNSETSQTPDIRGTWMQIVENGKPVIDRVHIKLITEDRFMWMIANLKGDVVAGASGEYSLEGNTFTEVLGTATLSASNLIGQTVVSEVTVEGNRMYKTMTLEGMEYTEVWEKNESVAPDVSLQGTWKEVEVNGIRTANQRTQIKLITENSFMSMMSTKAGLVFFGATGGYGFDGKTFTESIMLTTPDAANLRGTQVDSEITVEGKRMYKKMTTNGQEFSEVWEKMD